MACLAELRKRISEDFKFVGVAIVDSLLVALFLGSAFFLCDEHPASRLSRGATKASGSRALQERLSVLEGRRLLII